MTSSEPHPYEAGNREGFAATPPAEGLREALKQARDRLDDIFHAMHPGDYTEDELHGIAQNAYFGSEEIDRALAATPPAEGLDVERLREAAHTAYSHDNGKHGGMGCTPTDHMLDLASAALAPEQRE